MSIQSLTAKYRPQTFGEVAGQDAIKTILSRAAAEDRVAPAYLFSGTRGVGKTTIARIFAKALNCEKGPAAEPCNECSRCKQATAGVFPDVVEIDGASHGGVEHARSLKEDVGYAPMEGRYKVIIIDEAHMLSTPAFNALLKTLEEPPPRVTFIMATTEVRKFPATIVSRCQHYVFQMLTQQALAEHLKNILAWENIEFEPGAVDIIAKRGAGSVRDSMSLLGQTLALGQGKLEEQSVRSFLGLAGQDVFFALMAGIQAGDVVAVSRVLRDILDQGLDLGFFLRELTACWRDMFLLRQAGEQATELLSMSADEAAAWNQWAQKFSPAQIHASWQMTIEGQRRVMTSLEPALSLELLLLNLASLPDLLDLERLPTGSAMPGPGSHSGQGQRSGPAAPQNSSPGSPPPRQMAPQTTQVSQTSPPPQVQQPVPEAATMPEPPADEPPADTPPIDEPPPKPVSQVAAEPSSTGPLTVEGFRQFVADVNGGAGAVFNLHGVELSFESNELVLSCVSQFGCNQFEGDGRRPFNKLVMDYYGDGSSFRVQLNEGSKAKPEYQLREEAENHPALQTVQSMFDARLQGVARRRE